MERDSGTRSGLLWEVERLLKETKELPDVLIMENVPQVLKANGWYEWCEFLENLGYNNYAEVINAKRFGIPQNRERCFMVSILGDYSYNFPKGFELKYRLKDLLEENVDEKYYLSDKMISYLTGVNQSKSKFPRGERFIDTLKMTNEKGIAATINSKAGTRPVDNFVLQDTNKIMVVGKSKSGGERSLILHEDGICNCLSATDYKQPKQILIKEKTKKGYTEAQVGDGVYINRPEQKREVVQKGMIQTLKTSPDVGVVVNDELRVLNPLKDKTPYGWHFEQAVYNENGITRALKAGGGSGNIPKVITNDEINVIGNYSPSGHHASRIVDSEGIAPTVTENHGTVTATVVKTKNKRIHKIIEDNDLSDKDPSFLDIYNQKVIPNESGTLKAGMDHQQGNIIYNELRIRKLTPKECYRLMGVKDTDYNKITCSNAQKYKQAGNSIVTTCLMAIYSQLYKDCDYKSKIDDLLKELTTSNDDNKQINK